MEIREAKMEDLNQIADILEQISRIHYEARDDVFLKKTKFERKKDAIELIKDIEKKVLVAVDESCKVYGILIYNIKEIINHTNLKDSKILWIEELGVDEKYRKKGIGKLLIKEAEKIGKDQKCETLQLNCWEINKNAIGFYQNLGMETQRRVFEKKIGGD